jgi:hypothetical protein
VNENDWLAMRGFVDIVLGGFLISRFIGHSSELPDRRARLALFMLLSLLLAIFERLGVWSWREITTAAKMLPIVWPLVAIALYFIYKSFKLSYKLERAQFEIDWRREYQEELMQQLERAGHPLPAPRQIEKEN